MLNIITLIGIEFPLNVTDIPKKKTTLPFLNGNISFCLNKKYETFITIGL